MLPHWLHGIQQPQPSFADGRALCVWPPMAKQSSSLNASSSEDESDQDDYSAPDSSDCSEESEEFSDGDSDAASSLSSSSSSSLSSSSSSSSEEEEGEGGEEEKEEKEEEEEEEEEHALTVVLAMTYSWPLSEVLGCSVNRKETQETLLKMSGQNNMNINRDTARLINLKHQHPNISVLAVSLVRAVAENKVSGHQSNTDLRLSLTCDLRHSLSAFGSYPPKGVSVLRFHTAR